MKLLASFSNNGNISEETYFNPAVISLTDALITSYG
jgi:hypothetical protein